MKKLILMGALVFVLAGCSEDAETDASSSLIVESSVVESSVQESSTVESSEEVVNTEEVVDSGSASDESSIEGVQEEDASANEIILGEPFELGDYTITIHSFHISNDYEGNPALVFTYDWTNNSDETEAPFMTFMKKGFQNGIETTDDSFMVDGVDLGMGQKDVKPGGTITGAQGVVGIDDMNLPLEFEIEELFSFDTEPMTYIIEDLNNL